MTLKQFLCDWKQATGGTITKLPCGCYAGPCPCCGRHTMVVGLSENPCGGPDRPHSDFLPLARRLKK